MATGTLDVLIADDEPVARRGLRHMLERMAAVRVVAECASGQEAVERCRLLHPALALLDVQMPGLDGLSVARELGASAPCLVFVTAHDAHAIAAFDLHAVDYVLKPVAEDRLQVAVERARARWAARTVDAGLASLLRDHAAPGHLERLAVPHAGSILLVPVGEVDWLEAADNYVRVHAAGRRHLIRDTLKTLEGRLDPRHFVRVHRSAIVRVDRIVAMTPLPSGDVALRLRDGTTVTLSRTHRAQVERRLGG